MVNGEMKRAAKASIPRFLRKPRPRQIEGQALAEMLHLPRICLLRRCRRARQCLGPDLRCHLDHARIAGERWRAHDPRMQERALQRRIETKERATALAAPGGRA